MIIFSLEHIDAGLHMLMQVAELTKDLQGLAATNLTLSNKVTELEQQLAQSAGSLVHAEEKCAEALKRVRIRSDYAVHCVFGACTIPRFCALLQYAAARERMKSLQAQLQSVTEQAAKDLESKEAALRAQFADEKSTLEAVIQALEGEVKTIQEVSSGSDEERRELMAKFTELQQQLTSRGVDHAAAVQELEARLDESQTANADLQRTYQRQVT